MILSTNTQITQKFEAGIIDVLEKGVDIALFRCRRNRINFWHYTTNSILGKCVWGAKFPRKNCPGEKNFLGKIVRGKKFPPTILTLAVVPSRHCVCMQFIVLKGDRLGYIIADNMQRLWNDHMTWKSEQPTALARMLSVKVVRYSTIWVSARVSAWVSGFQPSYGLVWFPCQIQTLHHQFHMDILDCKILAFPPQSSLVVFRDTRRITSRSTWHMKNMN